MLRITGTMIYYYFVCKRKLWYFKNEITMEQNSELVAMGKILDETSYSREKKSILINDTINIDFVKKGTVLHEVKKTKSIEEAGIWQLKYYMFYLEKNDVRDISAQIDYPLIKETRNIILSEDDKKYLNIVEKEIEKIVYLEKPPKVINSKVCKKCSYYDLCYV